MDQQKRSCPPIRLLDAPGGLAPEWWVPAHGRRLDVAARCWPRWLDLYYRNDPDVTASTYQLTTAWLANFRLGKSKGQFVGFVDWAGSEGPRAANLLAQPKLLVDLGGFWGSPGQLYAGIEYHLWVSKFGIRDTNEYVPQAMAKWVF
jgi:hypothetical protein